MFSTTWMQAAEWNSPRVTASDCCPFIWRSVAITECSMHLQLARISRSVQRINNFRMNNSITGRVKKNVKKTIIKKGGKKLGKNSMFQGLIIRLHFQLQLLKGPVVWRVFTKLKKKESKIITFGHRNGGKYLFFFFENRHKTNILWI